VEHRGHHVRVCDAVLLDEAQCVFSVPPFHHHDGDADTSGWMMLMYNGAA
jgi:hypothetical protein